MIVNFTGQEKKIVNDVRYELFNKKYARENKVIDLSLIPPCQSTLMLHLRRSKYVVSIWKKLLLARFDLLDVHGHGWNQDYTIKWIEKTFPNNINELLLQEEGSSGKESFDGEFNNTDDEAIGIDRL